MTLSERLRRVAVLGAGGKMGSGISLLLAQEMTRQMLQEGASAGDYRLVLMDVNSEALEGLQAYLKKQAARFAKKNQETLSAVYADAAGEEEIAAKFVADMSRILQPVTDLGDVKNVHMVFEAILENLDLKVKVFSQLKEQCSAETYFFSNTSSIPIKELDQQVGLDGRIIGFHFYNPPAVQRLVELIIPENIRAELPELSRELGKRLRKIIIPSNDIAGFIGNGHFMRDGLHGIRQAEELADELGFAGAVYAVNRVSQDFLVRPMGIFQLIDYVGLDVFQSILKIMNPHFADENLHSELIDTLIDQGVRGGQFSDGSQKDGFLKYEEGRPAAIYDLDSGDYRRFDDGDWKAGADAYLGALPENHLPWKALLKDSERDAKLAGYFSALKQMDSNGARLALRYLQRSKEIGNLLVSGGVAHSAADVKGVLMNGFFHLYGPVNDFV